MPLLGLGSRLRSGSEVPSSYYFNLATWHTINFAYTQKAMLQLKDLYRDACDTVALDRLRGLIEERAGHWLALKVEEGKIALSGSTEVALRLERLRPPVDLALTRDGFDRAVSHLVDSVEKTVGALLRDAGVTPDAVDTVFFTGGASGVQLLRERIAALVPKARRVEGDLFGSIGSGLALDAGRRFA
jgi:hypothetical chaperone protein